MATTKPGSETVLVLSRTFAAPRERVFRAWTDPAILKKWWAAGPGFTPTVAEVDLRVGGRYRLGMRAPDQGADYIVAGTYREVQRPARLVYTWAWEGTAGPETLVTVEFHALPRFAGGALRALYRLEEAFGGDRIESRGEPSRRWTLLGVWWRSRRPESPREPWPADRPDVAVEGMEEV